MYVNTTAVDGKDVASLYPSIASTLQITQTLAVAEIFHSVFGLVPSPFFTTFIQVRYNAFCKWHDMYEAHCIETGLLTHWTCLAYLLARS